MDEPIKSGDMAYIFYDRDQKYEHYESFIRANDGAQVEVTAYRGDAIVAGKLYRMFRIHGGMVAANNDGPITSIILPGVWLQTVK